MASFLNKVKVNTAITDSTKFDLSHQMIQTADFMQLCPIFTKEMVPGEKLSVNAESFARLNPLPVPTMGRSCLKLRSFFVPYRTVFRGWNDFITDSVHVPSTVSSVSAIINQVPQFDNDTLVRAFINYSAGATDGTNPALVDQYMVSNNMVWELTAAGLNTFAWDIKLVDDTDTVIAYYVLTQKGRQALKILESLGYKIAWFQIKAGSTGYNPTYSALPLLCLARIYVDYYWPNQYTNMASYDELMSYCNRDNDNNTYVMTYQQIFNILSAVSYSQYDPDYFTAQWDVPNQPSLGTASTNFKLVNIDSVNEIYSTQAYTLKENGYVSNNIGSSSQSNRIGGADAPFITPYVNVQAGSSTGTIVNPVSEYLLHALHSLTDWMKRNQISGSKAAERYLSRYGKSLSVEQLGKSTYLGASIQDIQIGDIMSTSDTVSGTDGEQLGAYAGKGISYGNGHFECSSDEFGMFITLCSIVPNVGYFQGVDRTVKHLSKWDFYQPEADNLGVQATAADELYLPQQFSSDYNTADSSVFGYIPRYAEYKIKLDKVVGNFRLPSVNGSNPNTPAEFNGANSWYLMRVFDNADFPNGVTDIVHSPSFISGRSDFSQYKRIFYNVRPSAPDNFTIIHNFDVVSYSPMKSLFDTYEFEDKGKKVSMDVNGVSMN